MSMAYDIRKIDSQWGREYYLRDGMNWLVPVLFTPYFDWGYNLKRDMNGKFIDTPLTILATGIKRVWQDRGRIIRKDLWHNEE